MNRGLLSLASMLLVAAALEGCVLLFGGAAVGGAVVATDRRSVGMQLEDDRIEARVHRALDDRIPKNAMAIDVASYNRKVLLAGQVRTQQMRADAEAAALGAENVGQVVNELTVAEPASLSDRAADTVLAGKVKTALLEASGLPTGVVKTNVNASVVYLMGKVSASEGEAAAKAASRVGGVNKVVKLFEVSSDQEIESLKKHPTPPATE